MNWQKIAAFAAGIGAVGLGVLLMPANPVVGGSLVSAGSVWIGKLMSQPEFAKPQEPPKP